MAQAVDYRILHASGERSAVRDPFGMLQQQVDDAIRQGWTPCGGLAMSVVGTPAFPVYYVAQAMIRTLRPMDG